MELRLEKITKTFQSFDAVKDVSLELEQGVYGLLGHNGAGKTTLMRMMGTILRPTQGRITYGGRDVFQMRGGYRDKLGYLPQEFGTYPDFKVDEYLQYIATLKGLSKKSAPQRISALLDMVAMENHKKKKMKQLSGGMKRRVGIAQAMLNDPDILILDEPTAGLDPMERVRFRNVIDHLAENRIILLSTHIVADLESIADMVFLMKDGEIVTQGTVAQLRQSIGGGSLEDVFMGYFGGEELDYHGEI